MRLLRWGLAATACLMLLVPVAIAANDPLRSHQYGIDRIQADAAWTRALGSGVVIAVIDTGVHLRHEDLRDKLIQGKDFVDGDDVPQDMNGHGTHVAGIAAAATDNGLGIAGVAPAASIMPLRVLDADGTGVESHVAEAIRYAVLQTRQLGRKLVINMSLTDLKMERTGTSRQIQDAIREAWYAGALVVAAAGNDDLPYSDFPAAGPNVISVGATAAGDGRAAFSNRDPLVVAPGDKIVSTFWDPATPDDDAVYATGSGTSMAAPHVSGLAALLMSDGLNNEQAVERIMGTVDDLGVSGPDPDYGFGRVNAARALGFAGTGSQIAVPPETGPTAAENRFEAIRRDETGALVPGLSGQGSPARSGTMAAAVVALLAAYLAIRWQAVADAERDPEPTSVWEL